MSSSRIVRSSKCRQFLGQDYQPCRLDYYVLGRRHWY